MAPDGVLGTLEAWSPRLFLLGGLFELVFAANNGVAFVLEGFTFVDWLYPTVLLGRIAVLFGLAGLSVRVANRNPRAARWSRGILAGAFVLTVGLLGLSLLQVIGVTTPIIAVFGLGTVALTILTYAAFGVVVRRTGALPAPTGGLLLAAAVTVLGVFVGLTVLPTRLVGGVGEGVLVVLFLAIWRQLRADPAPTDMAGAPSTTPGE